MNFRWMDYISAILIVKDTQLIYGRLCALIKTTGQLSSTD